MTEPAKPGSWTILEMEVDPDAAEVVADALWGIGVSAVEEVMTSRTRVTLRANVSSDAAGVLDELAARHGATWRWVSVPVSVADTWREHATATHVVDDLWLVPAWVEPPDGRAVRIEPFDVFGLGNHPTTVLTLVASLGVVQRGDLVLDMGCGSGVLAVSLAVLGACRCECHDIAPQAQAAVLHNAALNGVDGDVAWRGPLAQGEPPRYDVVVANILAPVLRGLASGLSAVTRPGGRIVLGGMRDDQVDQVSDVFVDCVVESRHADAGWTSLVLRRG